MSTPARFAATLRRFANTSGGRAPSSRMLLLLAAAALGVIVFATAVASAAAPVVSAEATEQIGVTSALAKGKVNPEEKETNCRFDYISDAQFQQNLGNSAPAFEGAAQAGCTGNPLNGNTLQTVEAELTGLAPATEYHVRLVAENSEGESAEETAPSFETDAATAPTPAVTGSSAVQYTTATLEGSIDPNGGNANPIEGTLPISWQLQYAPAAEAEPRNWQLASPTSPDPLEGSEATSGTASVTASAGGLNPATEYAFRLVAFYAGGQEAVSPTQDSFTTLDVAEPTITNLAVSGLEAESAHFSAEINPNGTDPAFETSWHFECSPECSNLHGGTISAGTASQPVGEDAFNLQANTPYTLTLFASNLGGQKEASIPFKTPAAPPLVQTAGAGHLGQTEVTLDGFVNPRNSQTTYWFEWGSGDCDVSACQALPLAKNGDAGAGGVLVHVSQGLSGLTPQTTYHFRLVAQNSAGTMVGTDQTFTTNGAPASTCPNEAIREEQHSTFLPECRAYEMVSPSDKNGGGVAAEETPVIASTDGEGAAYLFRGSFGDTIGAGSAGETVYLARRGPDGWSSRGVNPTPKYNTPVAFIGTEGLFRFSDDLSRVVLATFDLPGTGATPETDNLYAEQTGDRSLQLLTSPTAAALKEGVTTHFAMALSFASNQGLGASDDSRHLAFKSLVQLTDDGLEPIAPRIYQWDEGVLRLASILPDGTPVGSPEAAPELAREGYRHSVSSDGSRVLFTYAGQLYMRVDHSSTVLISESENPAFAEPAQGVVLQQMTGDSRHVLFSTTSPLVPEDEDSESDLYLYADGGQSRHLTLLTRNAEFGEGGEVIGSSDSASIVYFRYEGVLYRAKDGAVSQLAQKVGEVRDRFPFGPASSTHGGPGGARVTPDGRYVALFAEPGIARDGVPIADTGSKDEIYLYDAVTDQLRCASCPAEGPATAEPTIEPNVLHTGPSGSLQGARPRFLSDDGSVFFSTTAALVPRDTDQTVDAYRYDPARGRVSLLSTGTSAVPSGFADSSSSGKDIFILTRQQLIAADRDGQPDLYDVRVDGGFPEPAPVPPPCSGESCRPPGAAPPPASSWASSQAGAGNHHAARHCPSGRRAVRRNRKRRCVKKHRPSRHQPKRRGHTSRGGSR